MLLDAAGVAQFLAIAEDAVERSKQLFGGKFFFVVGFGDFEHEQYTVDVEDFEAVEFAIITDSQNDEQDDNRDPNNGH